MSSAIGLILIIAGWSVQAKELGQGRKALSRTFVALYGLGTLFLAYDSYQLGLEIIAFLNLLCFFAAALALFKNKF